MQEIKRGSPPNERGRNLKYPFNLLDVGTFFEIPANERGAVVVSGGNVRVSAPAHAYAKRHNMTFAVRKQPSGNVRVFRVE